MTGNWVLESSGFFHIKNLMNINCFQLVNGFKLQAEVVNCPTNT